MSGLPHPAAQLRVLALDLDDTLLRSDQQLSPRSLDALRAWRATGRHLVIATGRPTRSVAPVLPPHLHDVPWITYNGAQVVLQGETLYANLIPPHDTRAVVSLVETALPDAVVGLEIDGTLYLNRPMARPAPYEVARLHDVATAPSAKILIFHADAALNGLLDRLPPGTRAMVSAKYRLVQVLAASADKAVALAYVVARWGLTLQHVIAFGDDVNDVDMVAQAGCGVAVANAVAEVLAVADHVTGSNDEDGVAAVLDQLLAALA